MTLHLRRAPHSVPMPNPLVPATDRDDAASLYRRMELMLECDTFNPAAYEAHVRETPVGFQRRRGSVAQIEVLHNLVLALTNTGVGMAIRRDSGRLATFLNETADQVIRSLFVNPFHRDGPCLVLVSILVSDEFHNLWITSLPLDAIEAGKLPRATQVAQHEDLSGVRARPRPAPRALWGATGPSPRQPRGVPGLVLTQSRGPPNAPRGRRPPFLPRSARADRLCGV